MSATSGWPAPSAFSSIASARLWSPSASAYLPCSWYTPARLLRASGHIGVVCAERLLVDRQRALEEPLGVGVLALTVHDGQVVEGGGHVGVAGAERLLLDRQRALVEPLGVGVLALALYTMARLLRV